MNHILLELGYEEYELFENEYFNEVIRQTQMKRKYDEYTFLDVHFIYSFVLFLFSCIQRGSTDSPGLIENQMNHIKSSTHKILIRPQL